MNEQLSVINFYRPQTKFAKVMFLHVSVSHSVHRGVVVSQHALQFSRPTPRVEVEGSGLGGSPGPHPGWRLRGLAGGGSPGPHPGGVFPSIH